MELRLASMLPVLAITLLAAAARADEGTTASSPRITVTRVSGDPLHAEAWRGVDGPSLTFVTGDKTTPVALADVIEISMGTQPDALRSFAEDEVRLDLWSGEEIAGRIAAGDEFGITVRNAALGDVRVDIDSVAGLRFPYRLAQVAEPPDLRPSADHDVIHLVGGDRIDCTITALGVTSLACGTAANDALTVSYERVTALRLMPSDADRGAARALTAVLRDGSRIRGTRPRVADNRLTLSSVSGFQASTALSDVVSVLVESDGFRYLSDLPAPGVDVRPFWTPMAGDPAEIYAPRMDRAFSGGLLRSGDRTWLKGIGVFSGTTLTWPLGGEWRELRTQVAVDDAAGRLGAVVFVIEVDGEERWRSDLVVSAGSGWGNGAAGRADHGTPGPVDAGRISVEGAQTLVLRVLAGDDVDPYPIQDEADWLGAMLIR